MAIPSGAILIFPTGTDIYSTKVDQGTVISGESHILPGSPNSGTYFTFYTYHVPLYNNGNLGTTVSIPSYTEVTGPPASANSYSVVYSGNNAGLFTFFAGNTTLAVTYTAAGDQIVAEWFNSLQTSVDGIESYILSGNATAVQVTGGAMTGSLTMNGTGASIIMNGGSIKPTISGTDQIGNTALPFGGVYSDTILTNQVVSYDGQDAVVLGNGNATMSGTTQASIISDNAVTINGNNTVSIYAPGTGVYISAENGGVTFDAAIYPTGSYIYDIGSPSQRWRTIYANSIDAIDSAYVATTGGSMTGPLTMINGQTINTDNINNALTNLTITSSNNLNVNVPNGVVTFTTPFVNINNNFGVGANTISVGSNVVPNQAGVINLGSPTASFGTIYANNIIGASASGAFVAITGSTMIGNLTMTPNSTYIDTTKIIAMGGSGTLNIDVSQLNLIADNNISVNMGTGATQIWDFGLTQITMAQTILPAVSGLYDIGSASQPLRSIYANNLSVGSVGSGLAVAQAAIGTVLITGSVIYGPNAVVISEGSGTVTFGSPADPIGTIYATNIVTNGASGATYLLKYGDTMEGNLALQTGISILPVSSGSNNIGSASSPIGAIYANNIFGGNLSSLYVAITGGNMTGPLTVNTINSTGNLTISANGFVNLTGNQITETAQQITLTSTVGPIILGANNELQMSIDGSPTMVLNSSGVQTFANIFPASSGNYSLGTPQNPFQNIYAQNIIPIGGSGTGTFLLLIGGTMFGDIEFSSGVGISFITSGTSNIGSVSDPAGIIYATDIEFPAGAGFVHVTGDSMTGNLTMNGSNILSAQSGNNIGSVGVFFQNAYITNIIANTIAPPASGVGTLGTAAAPYNVVYANYVSGLVGGEYVPVTGGSMYGNLTMNSGSNIILNSGSSINGFNSPSLAINNTGSHANIVLTAASGMIINPGILPYTGTLTINGNVDIPASYTLQTSNISSVGLSTDLSIEWVSGGALTFGDTSVYPQLTISQDTATFNISIASSNGLENIGTSSVPFNNIYAANFIGNFIVGTGDTITTQQSGVANIGSSNNPFNIVYANEIVTVGTGGSYVHITGDTMTGALNILSDLIVGPNLLSGGSLFGTTNSAIIGTGNGVFNADSSLVVGINNISTGSNSYSALFGDANYLDAATQSYLFGSLNSGTSSVAYSMIVGQGNFANSMSYGLIVGQNNSGSNFSNYMSIFGSNNNINASAGYNFVAGQNNLITEGASYDSVFGLNHYVGFSSNYSHVAGAGHTLSGTASYNAVAGQNHNLINAASNNIVGGLSNGISGGSNYNIVGGQNHNLNAGSSQNAVFGNNHSINSNSVNNLIGGSGNQIVNGTAGILVVGAQNTGTNGANFGIIAGQGNTISAAANSIIVGSGNVINNGSFNSAIFGFNSTLTNSSYYSLIAGLSNTGTNGSTAIAVFGSGNFISDSSNVVVGGQNNSFLTASPNSAAFGSGNQFSNATLSFAFGSNNLFSSTVSNSFAIGVNNNINSGPNLALVFGSGNQVQASNAVVLGNDVSVVSNSTGTMVLTDASFGAFTTTNSNTLYLKFLNGVVLTSGTNMLPQNSGTQNIGSSSNPFNIVYANEVVTVGTGGSYVHITGDTMTGDLNFTGSLIEISSYSSNAFVVQNTYSGAGSLVLASNTTNLNGVGGGSLTMNGGNTFLQSGGTTELQLQTNAIYLTGPVNGTQFQQVSGATFIVESVYGNEIVLGNTIKNGISINSSNVLYLTSASGITTSGTITPEFSGNNNIGSQALPYQNVYAHNFVAPVKTITGLSYTVASGDSYLLINSTGTETIGLPIFESGYTIYFKDKSGNANMTTNKIAITGIGCNLDGSAEYDINSNYGRLQFISDGQNWWRIE